MLIREPPDTLGHSLIVYLGIVNDYPLLYFSLKDQGSHCSYT